MPFTDTSRQETTATSSGINLRPGKSGHLRLLLIENPSDEAFMIPGPMDGASQNMLIERVKDLAGLRSALCADVWDAVLCNHDPKASASVDFRRLCEDLVPNTPYIHCSDQSGKDGLIETFLQGMHHRGSISNPKGLEGLSDCGPQTFESNCNVEQTDEVLALSESRLRTLISNLPGMVFQFRQDLRFGSWSFLFASEGANALLGMSPRELIHDFGGFLQRIAEPDRVRLEALLEEGSRNLASIKWDGRLCSSDIAPAVFVAVACKPRSSAPYSMLWEGVMIDITEQKMAEEALARSREELRALTLHMETVREEERKSMAREVHDDIGGILTALRFELAACRDVAQTQPQLRSRIASMSSLVDSAKEASDRIMRNLRPSILDHGIVAGLEWLSLQFSKSYSIECGFKSNREAVALDDEGCAAMFRICQEALTNVAKHANATQVQVELFADGMVVSLEICDNGIGILPDDLEHNDRFGIRGMRERTNSMGGWIDIHGSPSEGTTIMLSLPLDGSGQS